MRILAIASLLPVPDLIKENDVIFKFYEELIKLKKNYSVSFLRPGLIFPVFFRKNRLKQKIRNRAARVKIYYYNSFKIEGFPYFSITKLPALHSLFSLFAAYFYTRKCEKVFGKDFSIIHAQFIFPDGLVAYMLSRKYKVPYVITVRSEQKYFKNFISRHFAIKILKNAKFISTPSYPMYDYLNTFLDKKNKLELIPHGISEKFLVNKSTPNEDIIRLLCIGRLIPVKNYPFLLYAINELHTMINVKLTILGEGPEEEFLKDFCKKNNLLHVIRFIPHMHNDELPNLYKNHDVFVLPSLKETFGRVYFEAMASGLPVIMTKNTGVYGFIKENHNALVVDPKDINDLVSKVLFLSKNKEELERIGTNGKNLVKKFLWSNIAKRYMNEFEKIQKDIKL